MELAECQLHEALLNMAVHPDTPLWLLCPYDVESLPASVVEEAHRSHPVVLDVEAHRGSTAYGGAHHVGTMFEADLPWVDVVVAHRSFGDGDYAAVRVTWPPTPRRRGWAPTAATTSSSRCTRWRSTA